MSHLAMRNVPTRLGESGRIRIGYVERQHNFRFERRDQEIVPETLHQSTGTKGCQGAAHCNYGRGVWCFRSEGGKKWGAMPMERYGPFWLGRVVSKQVRAQESRVFLLDRELGGVEKWDFQSQRKSLRKSP